MFRIFLFILVTSFFSPFTSADLLEDSLEYVKQSEYSVIYGYRSIHWSTDDYTNSTHNLIAFRVNNLVFGHFKNSYGRGTKFLGIYGEINDRNFDFFGALGIMHGYTLCIGEDPNSKAKTCPLLSFGMSYKGYGELFQPALLQLGDATTLGVKSDF